MPSPDSSDSDYIQTRGKRLLIITQTPAMTNQRIWQQAQELLKYGYAVTVICPKTTPQEENAATVNGVHFLRYPPPNKSKKSFGYFFRHCSLLMWEFMLAWKCYLSGGFDAIAAYNPPDSVFLMGAFFKTFFNKKFLFDFHMLGPESEAAEGRNGGGLARMLERLALSCADIVVTANESYRRIAMERGKVAAGRVFIVRSGPSLSRIRSFSPIPALKRGRKYLVSTVGALSHTCEIRHFIEAARHIVQDEKRRDVYFIAVGEGPALEESKKLAALVGVSEYVNFMGRVSDQTLLEVLNTSDVCVNAEEVNALSDKATKSQVMEYMALGKAIVQFDVAEGRALAGEAADYAEPNDAEDLAQKILALLADPRRREAMGETGRAQVENGLNWKQEAPRLLAAYAALFHTQVD